MVAFTQLSKRGETESLLSPLRLVPRFSAVPAGKNEASRFGLGERLSSVPGKNPACACNGFYFLSVSMEQYPTEEDMIEWAKRESEREEKERLARLTQQEQEDLELAIALSKSELS